MGSVSDMMKNKVIIAKIKKLMDLELMAFY
jgi:hypothetical protein